MNVEFTPHFIRLLKKLPKDLQEEASEKIDIFSENWKYPLLKTHKLKGSMKEYWSFSVNYQYRIVFKKEKARFILMAIGNHDVYK